jgi:hypothetical protein
MSARQRRRRHGRRKGHHARRSPARRRLVAAGGLTAGATLAIGGVAHAAPLTFHVGTNADPGSAASDCLLPSNIDCSLRRAINLANGNADPGDLILFNSSLSGSTIHLATGHLAVTHGVSIKGPGASKLTIDGGGSSNIFYLSSAYEPASISGLTMTNGDASGLSGGAVFNEDDDLTISKSVISNSYATGLMQRGGGVYSHVGPLTIDHSTISGNHAVYGGGIEVGFGGTVVTGHPGLTVRDSTISGNHAQVYGGGVHTYVADTEIDRSTINGNYAQQDGGGIYSSNHTDAGNGAALTVVNSTITGNHAVNDDAGGIYFCCHAPGDALTVQASTITGNVAATYAGGIGAGTAVAQTTPKLLNSIVSGNTATGDPATRDLDSSTYYFFDTSFSLVGVRGNYVHTTIPGSNLFGVSPQLGGLANNGGPTKTELPADTSPVVNKGKAFGLTTDQRGLTRPVEFPGVPNSTAAFADGADMGAVELQLPPPAAAPPAPVAPVTHKKKCKKKKHKHSAQSAKKKKCKKKKRK